MMGRMTRKKAAEVAEQLHVDEDELLHLPSDDVVAAKAKAGTPEPSERAPLGEIASNSAESRSHSSEGVEDLKQSTRGRKGGKKGTAKGKTNDLGASIASQPSGNQQEVLPDDNESAPSPASEKAAEDLLKDVPERE